MRCAQDLASAALALILPACAEVPAGEHEIRLGIDGNADGFNFAVGAHGRLTVGRRVVPITEGLTRALAIVLAAVPGRKRAELVKHLAVQATAAGADTAGDAAGARRVRRALEKRTGMAWVATPSWKPRV